jgi:hypothetical protein
MDLRTRSPDLICTVVVGSGAGLGAVVVATDNHDFVGFFGAAFFDNEVVVGLFFDFIFLLLDFVAGLGEGCF